MQSPIDPEVAKRLDRLEHLIDSEYSGSAAEFERRIGIRMAQVNQWFSGYRALREKAARRIEELAKKPRGWLDESENDPLYEKLAAGQSEFVEIRRADVKFSNGLGSVIYYEDDKPPLSFRRDFLKRLGIPPGRAVVVDAGGISNEPKIPDGAVVLVNTADREHLNGEFFAFRADGELLIKRLEPLEGIGVLATADNPNFKPKSKIYREGIDDWEVIGRAVWTGAML